MNYASLQSSQISLVELQQVVYRCTIKGYLNHANRTVFYMLNFGVLEKDFCINRVTSSVICYSHKMQLLALLDLLQTTITDFPSLSHTSTSEIPTLSYT